MRLPSPPPEPPACATTDGLAPKFAVAIARVSAQLSANGWHVCYRETWRSTERAAWLYGFGRDYDDDRGIVTNAPTADSTWHHYWLAVDYGDSRYEPGNEPARFWIDLEMIATSEGLTCGADWTMKDRPHVQWGAPMRVSPSDEAVRLLATGGVAAVWKAVGAC